MKYIKLSLLFFFFITVCDGQGFLKTKGKIIVDGRGRTVQLRGIGLGGWMLQEPYMLQLSGVAGTQHEIRNKIKDLIGEENTKQFYSAWLENDITKADIDSLASWGFNSIRLPMHYNLFTPPPEDEAVKDSITWINKGFELTDQLLKWCRQDHIYLILDLHATPGGQGNDVAIADRDTTYPSLWQSEQNRKKTIALWKKLAERYSKETWIGGYDLINETNWGFENANDKNGCREISNIPLRELLIDISKAIREVDSNHILFIEANCWANNYKGILPAWDSNMVASFHKYWNFNDSNSIRNFISIRNTYNLPIWLGESGENSNSWFTDCISLMEKNGIGWAWWPLKKMGINNPLQIVVNPDYMAVVNYWRGRGPRPSTEEAIKAFNQLTDDIKIQNNIYHKDVTDAMFRQVRSNATIPFIKHSINKDGIVYASDYDLGKSGYAYRDVDSANYHVSTGKRSSWNRGGKYRNDGVDIEACTDSLTNGFKVFSIYPGEWLQYTVNAETEGEYKLLIRAMGQEGVGQIEMMVNGRPTGGRILITDSDKNWHTYSTEIALRKGDNKIRLYILKGGFELNYLQFNKVK